MAHEFGVSGHGGDRRPHRRAWTCPRGIVSLTTGMRFRAAIGPFYLHLSGGRAHHHRHFVRGPTEALHSEANHRRRGLTPFSCHNAVAAMPFFDLTDAPLHV